MPFIPTSYNGYVNRERVMLLGDTKAGKSWAIFQLADFLQRTQTPSTVYLIDTEGGAYDNLEAFPHLTNVRIAQVGTWEQYRAAGKQFSEVTKQGDWIAVDLFSRSWEAAQEAWTDEVLGVDLDDFQLQTDQRAKAAGLTPQQVLIQDPQFKWDRIKKWYNAWANPLLLPGRTPAHILGTFEVKLFSDQAQRQERDANLVEQFRRWGVRPVCAPKTPYLFRSILLVSKVAPGHHVLSTIGDRARPELRGVQLGKEVGFPVEYLIKAGNWRMEG